MCDETVHYIKTIYGYIDKPIDNCNTQNQMDQISYAKLINRINTLNNRKTFNADYTNYTTSQIHQLLWMANRKYHEYVQLCILILFLNWRILTLYQPKQIVCYLHSRSVFTVYIL